LWEGLERRAAGRQKYDNAQYREICKKTAREVASYVESFKDERGGNVSLVLGLDGSPSCGVNFSMNYGEKVEKPGIFFEELMREMTIGGIKPAYVGVSTFGRGIDYTIREIKRTLL
jgi:predicted secreted protein